MTFAVNTMLDRSHSCPGGPSRTTGMMKVYEERRHTSCYKARSAGRRVSAYPLAYIQFDKAQSRRMTPASGINSLRLVRPHRKSLRLRQLVPGFIKFLLDKKRQLLVLANAIST